MSVVVGLFYLYTNYVSFDISAFCRGGAESICASGVFRDFQAVYSAWLDGLWRTSGTQYVCWIECVLYRWRTSDTHSSVRKNLHRAAELDVDLAFSLLFFYFLIRHT
jgi:hypothetical protein